MAEERRRLEETAKVLRSRLWELQKRTVSEIDRPIHEVAVLAVRNELSNVGQRLVRMAA